VLPPLRPRVPAFSSIEKLVIPAEIGSIAREYGVRSKEYDENTKPGTPYASRRTVILIQDAHAVIDAQENIRKILAHLRNKYGVSLAALEGAKGRLEPILLRTFRSLRSSARFSRAMRIGPNFSGPEVESAFQENPGEFFGMEDWSFSPEQNTRVIFSSERPVFHSEKFAWIFLKRRLHLRTESSARFS